MSLKKFEVLKKSAEQAGFDSVDDYILHCEMVHTIKKMDKALDRAIILKDPPNPWLVRNTDEEILKGGKRKKHR